MKLSPVRIDEKPVMKTPTTVSDHVGVGVDAAVGRVERPAGVDAAGEHRAQHEKAADDEDVPARQIQPRKGQVAGADHQRHEKIAQHGGNRRNQKQKDHDRCRAS